VPAPVDVQVYRPVAGEEWRWVDTAPREGWTPSVTLVGSEGLLTVSDRDEVWAVSSLLFDVDPNITWRRGAWTLMADVPLRGEWGGEVNMADPRASALVHAGPWTGRVGVVAPYGGMDWPFTWDQWRVEAGASVSTQSWSLGATYARGATSSAVRAAAGVRWRKWTLEAAGAQDVSGGLLSAAEVTVSRALTVGRATLTPFGSVGVRSGPGTPRVRLGMTVHPAARVPPPVPPAPAPVLPPAPPPEPAPLPEPEPPPAPEPVPAGPPRVVRARIERHASCAPRSNEASIMDDLTQQARAFLAERSVEDVIIEVVDAECGTERGVDLIIVEVR